MSGLCQLPLHIWAWSLLCRAGLAHMDTSFATICPKSQRQIGFDELFATTNRCKSARSWLSLGLVLRARHKWGVRIWPTSPLPPHLSSIPSLPRSHLTSHPSPLGRWLRGWGAAAMLIHSTSCIIEKAHSFPASRQTLLGRRQRLLSQGWQLPLALRSGQGRGAWAFCKHKDGQILPGNRARVGSSMLNLSSNPLVQRGQQRWIFPLLLDWEA